MSSQLRGVLGYTVLLVLAFCVGMIASALISANSGHFGGWSGDFKAYHAASARWLAAEGLYASQLVAAPFPSVVPGAYLYPPTLALMLAPLQALTFDTAAVLWGGLQMAFLVAAVSLAARAGGCQRLRPAESVVLLTLPLLLWPLTWLIRDGNVGGLLALLAALTLRRDRAAGVALATAIAIKVVAVTAVPAAILAGRRMAIGLVAGLLALAVLNLLLAPGDSTDFPRVLVNLASGDVDKPYNLALNQTLAIYWGSTGASVGRAISVFILVALVAMSTYAAWRSRHRTAMSAAILATLFLPATLWVHYLVIILVPVATAWPSSPMGVRLISTLALVSLMAVPLLLPGPEHVLVTVVLAWLVPSTLWAVWRSEAVGARSSNTGWPAGSEFPIP